MRALRIRSGGFVGSAMVRGAADPRFGSDAFSDGGAQFEVVLQGWKRGWEEGRSITCPSDA